MPATLFFKTGIAGEATSLKGNSDPAFCLPFPDAVAHCHHAATGMCPDSAGPKVLIYSPSVSIA